MADISTGLIHHWRFDGNLGASVGGTDFTGTVTYTTGQIGQAAVVASGATINAGNLATTNFGATDSFTIAFWARYATNPSATNFLVHKKADQAATTAGWQVYTAANGANANLSCLIADGSGRGINIETTGDFTPAVWHHCVMVVDRSGNGSMVLYIDGGVADNTTSLDGSSAPTILNDIGSLSNSNNLTINRASSAAATGIDDLRIYSRALAAADVTAMYAFTGESFTPLSQGKLSGIIGRPLRGRI